MGSGSTEASDESVDASAASATGPDWGQVALVLLAAAILALAAVTIPPLGGVGLQGQGPAQPADEERSSGFLQLGSDSSGGGGGTGDQQLGSDGSGGEDGTGDREGTGSTDGEGFDSIEDGPESGADGDQPGEMGDGSGESGPSSGADSDSEFDDGGEGRQDGAAGDQPRDGSDVGADAGDGTSEPFQGEFGSGSGDGTAEGSGDQPGGASTDGQGDVGDGTTASDGDSSGDSADGTDSETGDGSGESAGDSAADGDGSTTGDGDSSQDGNGDGDAGSGDDSSESDTQDSSGDGETDDGEDADDTGEDGTDDEDGTSYEISFDDQPTPGSTVAVTVTGDGDPVEGATVYFNDEQVGTTDADGTVTGEVPYTETLEVRADVSPTETETTTARGSISGPALPGLDSSRQFHGAVAMPLSMAQDSQAEDEDGNGTRTTVEMNPETDLTIDGDPIAGTDVTVVATVDGNPIPQGTVFIDGEEYGTTDDDGAAVIPVPETPGNATIAVERGEIRAERTVTVEALSVTVDDRFPLPGRSVDARLEYSNESVANATVLVDGAAAATTGADGTATVGLPLANEATIAAEYESARATTTVDGLYRNAALLLLAVVVGVVLLWRLTARYGAADRLRSLPSPASLLQRIGDALRTLGRRAVDAIVRLARSLESFGYWIAGRARAVAGALERVGRWFVALPGELATKGLAALAALHPIRLYRYLRDAIRSLLRSSRERVDDVTEAVTGTDGATGTGGDEGADEDVRTLRELWAEFVRLVRPPRLRTKTPGEIGRYAVEKGFPEPPVRTVVDAFRDSEYGKTAPSGDRLERVRSAVRAVTDGDDADEGRDGGISDEDDETDGDRR